MEVVNGKNVWDILKLRALEAQRGFVAANDVSIIEAYIAITAHGHAFPFGIYDGETPVGFLAAGCRMSQRTRLPASCTARSVLTKPAKWMGMSSSPC